MSKHPADLAQTSKRDPRMIPIDRALMDSNLLGAALGDGASWSTWLAVLRAAFALPMCNEDRATFAKVAGDRDPPSRAVSEFWAVCGRRSGKTRTAAAVSVYIGAIKQHRLARGEVGFVLLLAASRDQAAIAYRYVLGFLESSPILRQQVESVTTEVGCSMATSDRGACEQLPFRAGQNPAGVDRGRDILLARRDQRVARHGNISRVCTGTGHQRRHVVGISTPYRRSACCTRSSGTTSVRIATKCWSCRATARPSTRR